MINFKTKLSGRARWALSCFYFIFSTGSACWLYSQSIKMPWWCHLAGTMQLQRLGREEACNVDGDDMSTRLLSFSSCYFQAILFKSFTLVAAWNSAATQDNFYTFQEIWVWTSSVSLGELDWTCVVAASTDRISQTCESRSWLQTL